MSTLERVDEFESFVVRIEPQLRAGLVAARGRAVGSDATAEALAWAWETWPRVLSLNNPAGYLFRIGMRRPRPQRRRDQPKLAERPPPAARDLDVARALEQLSRCQRVATYLVHGLGWTLDETAQVMNVSVSSVRVHAARGLSRLQRMLSEEGES